MTCKAPLSQVTADKPLAVELVSQFQTAATANSAWRWAPLRALMAEGRGSPSGTEMSALTCRKSVATTTGSPVTTKWCDPTAVLLVSLYKSTIQIRSASTAFIRLTKPIRDACISVSNTCSYPWPRSFSMTRCFERPSKASVYNHGDGQKDKYFNHNLQKLATGATIISLNGNLNWAAQWAGMWMLVTKNWTRGSYTDFNPRLEQKTTVKHRPIST